MVVQTRKEARLRWSLAVLHWVSARGIDVVASEPRTKLLEGFHHELAFRAVVEGRLAQEHYGAVIDDTA
jgi:hypothetical protein